MPHDVRAELAKEREDLLKADCDIAAGEERIARHCELIERLRRDNHEVSEAEVLLKTLRQTLQTWRDHRVQIVRRIDYLESSPDLHETSPKPGG